MMGGVTAVDKVANPAEAAADAARILMRVREWVALLAQSQAVVAAVAEMIPRE